MSKNPKLRSIGYELYLNIMRQKDVYAAKFKDRHILWILKRDHWYRLCWFSISEYSPGCYRFRNDLVFDIPKSFWPFPHSRIRPGKFELTVHESEISQDTANKLFLICSDPNYQFDWKLFKEKGEVPDYSWSEKAKAHHNETKKASTLRRIS